MINNIFTLFNHALFWGLLVYVYRTKGRAYLHNFAESYNDDLSALLGERSSLRNALQNIEDLHSQEMKNRKIYESNMGQWSHGLEDDIEVESGKVRSSCKESGYGNLALCEALFSEFSQKIIKESKALNKVNLDFHICASLSRMLIEK